LVDRSAKPPLDQDNVISRVEKELMVGGGRWIADFTESFREYQINDVTFDAFIRGNTRTSGFLISRFYSFFMNPNYEVACYLLGLKEGKRVDRKTVRKVILAVKDSMKTNEVKWSWLYIVGEDIDPEAAEAISTFLDQTVGLVCVGMRTRHVLNNNTFLGRQAKKYLRL
jgi:hypothetical protein